MGKPVRDDFVENDKSTSGPEKMLKQNKKCRKSGVHIKIISPPSKWNKCGCLVFLGNNEGTLTTDAELQEDTIIMKAHSSNKKWSAVVAKKIDTIPGKSVEVPLKDIHKLEI